MVKTTSGKKATVRGSNESKRAVAHSRSVPSPGVSKTRAIAIPSPPSGAKKKNSVASAVSAGSARTAKVVRPAGKKSPGQSKVQAGLMAGETGRIGKAGISAGKQASATEAAANAGRKRNTKQGSKLARVRVVAACAHSLARHWQRCAVLVDGGACVRVRRCRHRVRSRSARTVSR